MENCIFCNKKIRKCKNELPRIEFHFSCKEKEIKKQYEKELKDFIEWFKTKGIDVII